MYKLGIKHLHSFFKKKPKKHSLMPNFSSMAYIQVACTSYRVTAVSIAKRNEAMLQ